MQLHLPFPEFIAGVQCEHCLKAVAKPHFVVKHTGLSTIQLPFCDELCHELFYLGHLRKAGM